ncbi:MAG: hypothetical protein U5K74_15805 [Gemmatimonadaceae bacterium]|nr:hypothetical protein [Gemmatimonadaceae bacterium]
MSQRTVQLVQRATIERERLSEAFDSLGDEIQDLKNWRRHVNAHPSIAIGAALAAGFILGAVTAPRQRRRARGFRDYLPDTPAWPRVSGDTVSKAGRIIGEIVIAQLMAAATARLRRGRRGDAGRSRTARPAAHEDTGP